MGSEGRRSARPATCEALEEETGVEDREAGAALPFRDRQEGEALAPGRREGRVGQTGVPIARQPVSEGASSSEEGLLCLIEQEVHGGPTSP